MFCLLAVGCARLPVPVEVVHEDQGLLIRTERVATDKSYTHPISLKAGDLARILRGISVQERHGSFPLQLYGKASGPERLFGEREIRAIAPYLAAGLQAAKPDQRVAFALYEPGSNPTYERIVTSGWIAVRAPFFHVAFAHVRSLQPISPTHSYFPFYPEMPPAPPPYDVFFEPQQFWMTDPADGTPAVQFSEYLRTVEPPSEGG
jgi:hypothetical protein